MAGWRDMSMEVGPRGRARGWAERGSRPSGGIWAFAWTPPPRRRCPRRSPVASPQALEDQYSPSRWSPRLDRDTIIDAHLAVTAAGGERGAPGEGLRSVPRPRAPPPPPAGTERARVSAQTLLHVPYGNGDGEKLDIYFPTDPSKSQ